MPRGLKAKAAIRGSHALGTKGGAKGEARTDGKDGGKGARASPARARARGREPFERGARVRVLDGPFAGRVGVVQELDGKGSARVMLGLLAVRLDVKNLIAHADGARRPRLSTSHHKPAGHKPVES